MDASYSVRSRARIGRYGWGVALWMILGWLPMAVVAQPYQVEFNVVHDNVAVEGAKVVAINSVTDMRVDSAFTDAMGKAILMLGITNVATEEDPGLPDGFQMSVYPNPAAPGQARVQVVAPVAREADLVVYDVLGREVARKRVFLQTGVNTADVPGTEQLAAGTYFVRVQAGSAILTRTLVIAGTSGAVGRGIPRAANQSGPQARLSTAARAEYRFEVSAAGYGTYRSLTIDVARPDQRQQTIELFVDEIAEDVVAITGEALQEITSVSEDQTTIVISSELARDLEVGDIIVAGVGPQTPEGLLRRIVSKEETAGKAGESVTLTCEQATLEEVIVEGNVVEHKQLTTDDLEEAVYYVAGITPNLDRMAKNPTEFSFTLKDVVVYDEDGKENTKEDQLLASGSITFIPELDVDWRFEKDWPRFWRGKVTYARFKMNFNMVPEIKLYSIVSFNKKLPPKTLIEWRFAPITLPGPVPVVITPKALLQFVAEGKVEVGFEVEARATVELEGGVEYDAGDWNLLGDASFEVDSDVLDQGELAFPELELEAKAGLQVPFTTKLYGVAGPEITVKGELEAEVEPLGNPWWSLDFTLGAFAGFKVEALGKSLVDFKFQQALARTWPIIDAGGPLGGGDGGGPTGETFTNSIGMEFIRIPAGTFQMGDIQGGGDSDERPVHTVTLTKDFYIGKYEVTQAQWEAVMGSNPSWFSSCGGDCPVERVSWNDVQAFIDALNAAEGTTAYRLPTEAEWEYAARAGTTTKYSFGNEESQLGNYAWYSGNSGGTTHPVGQKQPNPWGLYDMHGNVWEWVQDWYSSTYYSSSPGTDPAGPGNGTYRVIRGGGWNSGAFYLPSASRGGNAPGTRSYNRGFRLVRSAE